MMATLRPLSEELRKVAATELHEVEERVPEDIAALRTWLAKQPHLRSRTDDQFLVAFLRGCKYSLEKVKTKLDYFYTIKTIMPEIFTNDGFTDKALEFGRQGVFVGLPTPMGPGGPRIYITKYGNLDTKKYTFLDLCSYQVLSMQRQIVMDDNNIISGEIEIVDFKGMSLSLLAQFDFTLIKKLSVFAEKAAPTRIKGIHLLNVPKEAAALMNMARSFFSEKLQKRFYVHKNVEELHKIIAPKYLPVEYGGTSGTLAEMLALREAELLSFADYFLEESKYGVDEKLRLGEKIDTNSLFGLQGSFRKLDID